MDTQNKAYLLDGIQDILITLIYTASVRGAVPISSVLVADSGTAKSKLIKMMWGEGLHHTDSFTSNGLFELMQRDGKNVIRWIMVADLNPTLSRQQKTVVSTMSNLLTLTMDGTCRVDDGRQEKTIKHRPIGLLTAVTPEIFKTQTKRWFALGLTRRIIPLFYEYTRETTSKLIEIVREGKISMADFCPHEISLPGDVSPAIREEMSLQIESLAAVLTANLGMTRGKDNTGALQWWVKKIIPISPIIILRTLSQANAIRHGRGSVTQDDIIFCNKFIDFTNPASPKQI